MLTPRKRRAMDNNRSPVRHGIRAVLGVIVVALSAYLVYITTTDKTGAPPGRPAYEETMAPLAAGEETESADTQKPRYVAAKDALRSGDLARAESLMMELLD